MGMGKKNLISLVFIGTFLLYWSVVPVSGMSATVTGESVLLSGKGGGYDDMYLFLTGPNLAPGGVRLDSISSPVVSGTGASFTRTSVRNGVWEYDWDTGRTGGTPDPGIYLVWAVPEPLDRYDIRDTSYATISIFLTKPVLNAEVSGYIKDDAPEETGGVTPGEMEEGTDSVASMGSFGNNEISDVLNGEVNGVQDVSGDTTLQPTTAGSFSYPFVGVAGIGIVFLLITGIKIKL